MRQAVGGYATVIFDCDGVVLDSNRVKTEAFYQATLPYGEDAAKRMVEYHVNNGGVSRYKKFRYFLDQIVPGQAGPDQEALLAAYAEKVRNGLLICDIAPGLNDLRHKTRASRWLVVSGGDQVEVREILAERGIAEWFDGGIFGSPDTKTDVLRREIGTGNIQHPGLFLGDSKYDHQAAREVGMDFFFFKRMERGFRLAGLGEDLQHFLGFHCSVACGYGSAEAIGKSIKATAI